MIEKVVHWIKHVLISNLFLNEPFSLVLFQKTLVVLLRTFTVGVFLYSCIHPFVGTLNCMGTISICLLNMKTLFYK